MIFRALLRDQMELTSVPPPGNASSASSPPLCSTTITLLLLPSAYALLILLALPGNTLSLWVFCRCISSVTPTHIYLSHLSMSNLLSSFTSPFLAMYYAHGSTWPLSGALCQFVLHGITLQLHMNIYIGLVILTLVALSRFASLIRHTHASRPSACATLLPYRFFRCLTRTTFASRVCVGVWVMVIGGIVPVTVYYSIKVGSGGGGGGVAVCYSPEVELGGKLSAALAVPPIFLFFILYALVLLCYMTVLRHIKRSRRSTNVPTSHSLLGRVLRNIVVIQVVLSVCLLPYHIFKPIFVSMVHHQPLLNVSPHPDGCHPLSSTIEMKNVFLLLAALRGATDPLMYFMLDKSFRHQTLTLFRCNKLVSRSKSVTGSVSQSAGQTDDR